LPHNNNDISLFLAEATVCTGKQEKLPDNSSELKCRCLT